MAGAFQVDAFQDNAFQVQGGIFASRVFIDGEGVTIERKSLQIHTAIEERSTAQFNVIDKSGTSNYQKGQPVEIYDWMMSLSSVA